MNRSKVRREAPGGLVADSCKAILAARPSADAGLIARACTVAARCHEGQTRRSGDPYITHPVAVATILASLHDVDDPTLCTGILHDTVEDTPYTPEALRRDFGSEIALMVKELKQLDRLGGQHDHEAARVIAVVRSTDTRVVAVKAADRLHNMRTLQFLPRAKQIRKARESLDTFVPVTRQLRLDALSAELQTLAFTALTLNQPLQLPRHRVIVALDIERSTSRPDPVKAGLRTMLYELFDAALRTAGVSASRRDPFADRGDGLLALIESADCGLILTDVIPAFSQHLASYNTTLYQVGDWDRRLRVRIAVHAGNIHDDENGCFGEAIDATFRLLDDPRVKMTLRAGQGPLIAVISASAWASSTAGTFRAASGQLITTKVAGHEYQGRVVVPLETA